MPEPDVEAPDLINDHDFEPWEYTSGEVRCIHWDPNRPTRRTCEQPASEHARVSEG